MSTFSQRMVGAAKLEVSIYKEVRGGYPGHRPSIGCGGALPASPRASLPLPREVSAALPWGPLRL